MASSVRSADHLETHPSERWQSVIDLLDTRAAEHPQAPAISFPSGQRSYGELAQASVRAARRLRAAGVEPGDRVGILLREASAEYVEYGLGAIRMGAICVPINARNKTHELGYVLDHTQLRALLTAPEFAELIEGARPPESCRTVVIGEDEAFEAAAEQISEEEIATLARGLQRTTPALLLYTSGTTANPKGCLHAHATLLAEGHNCSERLGLTAEDRFWTPLALFHVGGWQVLMSAMAVGGCLSHVGFFDATTALDQLERERCTAAMPAFELIWMAVLEHPRFPEADLSAMRVVMNVGVPERLERSQKLLPHAVQVSMIGMTESCGSICIGHPSDPLESRTRTSGRPLRGIEIRVLAPDGSESPPGVPGELVFRGVTRFAEYYRDPVATAATIDPEGWTITGDLVTRNEDGTITFVGRMKDMLKVGGENASAAEIEGYLITHPAVAVAAVVAAPDARYGEVPCAFVQKTHGAQVTEQELIEYCLDQIATYKVPRYVRFVDEYPVSASAKVQKYVLREVIASELREQGIAEAPKIQRSR